MTSALASRVSGPVYTPDDKGYETEAAAFIASTHHTPQVIVGAESAEDVAEAVRFARENGYSVTVQATGHGAHKPVTSGILITTKRMNNVSVDAKTRTAVIGAGTRWESVVAAAAPLGLAPITGSSTKVGIVGYLLGGGLGPLSRSHGYSSDYLVSLTVVTGTGEIVKASAEENPDLFWALRGGKWGLGIVTEVELRLVELASLYAGSLFFEEKDIETALRAWVDWTATADPQVTTSIAIIRFPPFEGVPAPLRGRRLLSLRFAYPSTTKEGEQLAAPLRAAAPVYMDNIAEMPAAEIAHIHNDPTEPAPGWTTGMLLSHIDQEFASVLLKNFGAGTDAPFIAVEVRQLGSAMSHPIKGGSAVGGQKANFTLGLVSTKQELFQTEVPAFFDRLLDVLKPWIAPETNANFMGAPRSPEHFASAWPPATFAKLAEIRHQFDPDGLFAQEYQTA